VGRDFFIIDFTHDVVLIFICADDMGKQVKMDRVNSEGHLSSMTMKMAKDKVPIPERATKTVSRAPR
jgi:hypothetical protein